MATTGQTSVNERIGRNVKILLVTRGLMARDLGRALGVSESAVSRRLHGKNSLSASDLAVIADYLGVEPGVLFLPTEQLVKIACSAPFGLVPYAGQMEIPFEQSAKLIAV